MSTARLDVVDKGLPRRLSVLRGDRHYDPGAKELSGRITVLLDGVELDEVASYDVDAGEIVRNKRYRDGGLILQGGVPVIESLRGRVEVRWAKKHGRPETATASTGDAE